MHFKQSVARDTVSIYHLSMQLVIDKKLEALNKA